MANIAQKTIKYPGLPDTYTFLQLDDTLSTAGKAADAKKTGDELTSLKSEIPIVSEDSIIPITAENKWIPTNGSTVDITDIRDSAVLCYSLIQCSANDVFTLNVEGSNQARAYAFIDANGNVKSRADINTTLQDVVVTAPASSAYLIINNLARTPSFYGKRLNRAVDNHDKALRDISGLCGIPLFYQNSFVRGSLDSSGNYYVNNKRLLSDYIYLGNDTIFHADSGYNYAIARYNKTANGYTFISPVISFRTDDYVLDQNCYVRIAFGKADSSDINDTDYAHLHVSTYSRDSIGQKAAYTERTVKELTDIHGIFDTTSIDYVIGSLDSSGADLTSQKRIRSDYVPMSKGTLFHVDDGYKFSLSLYTKSDSTYTYSGSVFTRTEDYILGRNCYIRFTLGKTDDSDLDTAERYTLSEHIKISSTVHEKKHKFSLTEGNIRINEQDEELNGENTDEYWATNFGTRRRTDCFLKISGIRYLRFGIVNASNGVQKLLGIYEYDADMAFVSALTDLAESYVYYPADNVKYIKVTYKNNSNSFTGAEYLEVYASNGEVVETKHPYKSGTVRFYVPTKDSYYTSMLFKLPPNYTASGDPVPLIIFLQGASDYGSVDATVLSNFYEPYTDYLRDNGFCVWGCHGFGSLYTVGSTMFGVPRNMRCIKYSLEKLFNEYNIDKNRVVVVSKSQGGYVASLLPFMQIVDVKAVGMLAPALNKWQHQDLYGAFKRQILVNEFGFDTDTEWFVSEEFARNERYLNFLRANAYLSSGYDGYWRGLVGNSFYDKCEDSYSRTWDTTLYRELRCPVKIWISQDDANVPYGACDAYVKQAQNAGYDAQLRTLPNNTGGHMATDSDEHALQTYNVTTRLGIEYAQVPTAYYELNDFLIKKLNLPV